MMKRIFLGGVSLTILLMIGTEGCQQKKEGQTLSTHMDTISYCVGVTFGANLQKDGFDTIDTRWVSQGLSDYVDKKELLISREKARKILMDYRGRILKEQQLRNFEDNRIAGEKFLEENGKQPGVVTLPSGLQYKIIREGKGPKPGPKDLVKVRYKGALIDGTVFEEHLTGPPVPFFVNRVIKGWNEVLPLMPEGSYWKVFIPYQLGYGTEFSPNSPILPYSTLIFDLELVKVEHRE